MISDIRVFLCDDDHLRFFGEGPCRLIHLIEENPSLLRRPIILDNKRMQIGFNEDEIRAFLPRSYRKQELRSATLRAEINKEVCRMQKKL